MKKFLKSVWCGIKKDLAPVNKDFKFTLLWCAGIAVSSFLSLFWTWPVFVTLVLCAGAVLISKGGRAVYILVFMIPLNNLTQIHISAGSTLMGYIFRLALLMLSVKYIIRVCRKQEKIELLPIMLCSILIFLFALRHNLGLIRISLFLYIMWNFRHDIHLREIFILFFLGIVLSGVFGLFTLGGDIRASKAVVLDIKGKRYSALAYDPNIFSLETVLCLAILFVLSLNGDMRNLFYPMFAFLLICIISTGSKAGIVVLAFALVVYMISYIWKSLKNSDSAKKIIIFCTAVATVCIICAFVLNDTLRITLGRFTNVIENGGVFDNITTYRYGNWKENLQRIFSNFWKAIFGWGYGGGVHNTYIHLLSLIGIFGVVVMTLWGLITFIPLIKQKKVNWFNSVAVIAFGLCLMSENMVFFFSLAIFLVMLLPTITYHGNIKPKQAITTSNIKGANKELCLE